MGLFAHATHLHFPDKEVGRLLVASLLKSPQPLVLSKPYGNWINVYIEMGLSYKDVPEFPTTTYIELNCYDDEGLDVRLYTRDRLAFLFESGCGELAAQDEQLMEIAASLWEQDPQRPVPATTPAPEGEEGRVSSAGPSFWALPQVAQEHYINKARDSREFRRLQDAATGFDDHHPDPERFEPLLPPERTVQEFGALLAATTARLHGPPIHQGQREAIEKWMGKAHSTKASDYVAAIAKFLGLRGSLWSLDSIRTHLSDKIDRRLVALDHLEQAPPGAA